MEENWKPVPGWESSHDVSDLGSVWNKKTERVLKPSVRPNDAGVNYAFVVLHDKGKKSRANVATLVLSAFIRPKFPGECPKWLDGDRTNCCLYNLEWQENVRRGGRIDDDKRSAIREAVLEQGLSTVKVAKMFDVSQASVSSIKFGFKSPNKSCRERGTKGGGNRFNLGPCVLTWEQVHLIRRVHAAGRFTTKQLFRLFHDDLGYKKLTRKNMQNVINNRTWKEQAPA